MLYSSPSPIAKILEESPVRNCSAPPTRNTNEQLWQHIFYITFQNVSISCQAIKQASKVEHLTCRENYWNLSTWPAEKTIETCPQACINNSLALKILMPLTEWRLKSIWLRCNPAEETEAIIYQPFNMTNLPDNSK